MGPIEDAMIADDLPPTWRGTTPCLRCGLPFRSADVRRHRVCRPCNVQNTRVGRLAQKGAARSTLDINPYEEL